MRPTRPTYWADKITGYHKNNSAGTKFEANFPRGEEGLALKKNTFERILGDFRGSERILSDPELYHLKSI